MKLCPKRLALFLSLTLAPFQGMAEEEYCRNVESETTAWGKVEHLSEALAGQADEGVEEIYLVRLADGTEMLFSGVEEDSLGDESIIASAKKPKKKRSRYSNRGILGPAGKWPVNKGSCTILAGKASFYGGGEKLKKRTASGKVFTANSLSAAHRTLPLGSKVEITNVKNGRKVSSVVIDDRGPAIETSREIDVTKAVAKQLDFIKAGHTQVKIKVCRS